MSDVLQFTAGFAGPATTPLRQAIEYAQTGPFGTQLTADEYVDGGVPVINPTHIQRGRIAPDDSTTVTPEKAEDLARYRLAVGDIVLGRKGEVDKSALVNQQSEGYVCGSDAMALRPRLGTVPDYLWWFLQSSEAHSQLEFWSVGATVSGLNQNTIRKVRLPLPDVQDQQRIASYLDRETARIDTLIEEQQRLIEMLRERRAVVLSSALAPTGSWVRRRIKHIGETNLGKMLDAGRAVREEDEPRPYVRAADVRADGSVNLVDLNEMPFSEAEMELFDLCAGDVLLIEGGATVGRPGFMFESAPGIAFQKTVNRFRVGPDVDARFVYWSMLRLYDSAYYANHYGSVSFVHLTGEKLREIDLHLPALDEQRRIAVYLDEQTATIDALIAETERFIDLARERRAALITAAVTGQIDVREMG